MTIAFKFDEAVGCYFVRWTGVIAPEEYHSYIKKVIANPWFRKGLDVFHDSRDATIEIGRADTLTMADAYDLVAPVFGEGRGAILVNGSDDMRLLKRGVGASAKARDLVRVFYNYDAARAWLALPEDYPDPFEGELVGRSGRVGSPPACVRKPNRCAASLAAPFLPGNKPTRSLWVFITAPWYQSRRPSVRTAAPASAST